MKRRSISYLVSVLAVALTSCSLCGNDLMKEELSPDGTLKAVIFNRDCGATTSFSTNVSVISSNADLPNEAGNALVMDEDARFANITAQWTGPRTLMVLCHPIPKVFKLEHRVAVGLFGSDSVSFDVQDQLAAKAAITPVLQLKIEEILARHDPESLKGYGCSESEYRPEAKFLLEFLPKQPTLMQVEEGLNNAFHSKFDVSYTLSSDGRIKNLVRVKKPPKSRKDKLHTAAPEIYRLLTGESTEKGQR